MTSPHKNRNSLISVVVPVYNAESTLRKCLDSIINQSYKNLEILLINDGSEDNSYEICKKYSLKDRRIRVIDKKNGGPSDARNAALKEVNGEYVAFVDSDDWTDPDMFMSLLKNMHKYNSEIAVCGICQVYGNIKVYNNRKSQFFLLEKNEALGLLFDNNWGLYSCNKLFKTMLFDNVIYPTNKYFEDNYTIYKLFLKANRVSYDTRSYYYYRQRKNSTTHVFGIKNMIDEITSYEEIYNNKNFYEYREKIRKIILAALCKYYDNNKKIIENDKKINKIVKNWVEKYCDIKNFSVKEKVKWKIHKNFNWIFVIRYKISSNSGPVYGYIKKLAKNRHF